MLQRSWLWAGLLVFSLPALMVGQDCTSIIALSRVVTETISDSDSLSRHASNFCDEYSRSNQQSRSASFGASYKFLSASFGSSGASIEQVASRYCSSTDISESRSDAYRQYVELIAPGAYSAYERCLALSRDIKFSVDQGSILAREFSLLVNFSSSINPVTAASLVSDPSSGIQCRWRLGPDEIAGDSISIRTGSTAALKCTRTDSRTRGSVRIFRSDGPLTDALTLPWPAYTEAGEPVDTLAQLSAEVARLRDHLAELSKACLRDSDQVVLQLHGGNLSIAKEYTAPGLTFPQGAMGSNEAFRIVRP